MGNECKSNTAKFGVLADARLKNAFTYVLTVTAVCGGCPANANVSWNPSRSTAFAKHDSEKKMKKMGKK